MAGSVEIVRGFPQLRVLVVGDVMLDSYLEGKASRLCTEGPVPVVRKTSEERLPGGAANTAANLAALGARVILLGVIGTDSAGLLLRSALRDHDIDDSWLVADGNVSTHHKLRILADGQFVVRFDEGGTDGLGEQARLTLIARLEHAFASSDVVVISDYNYGVASDELLAGLRRLRAGRDCPLIVDSKNLGRFRDIGATVLTPNHLEAQLAIAPGQVHDGPLDLPAIERLGRRLIEATDAENIAITLAADGVCLIDRRGHTRHFPAYPVPHANDIGAGDSFVAALALSLAAGAECGDATRISIEAASLAVSKQRTAVVSHQELLQRVSLQEHVPFLSQGTTSMETVAAQVNAARRAGQTVVFTNGVFDILHAGHVEFLRRARELGDVLVVGVNSDRSALMLKGKNRPINSERDRLALVSALDPVSHAVLFDEVIPAQLIRTLRPDLHVKGGDYADTALPESDAVHEVGGRIVILPLDGSLSDDSMIDRIISIASTPAPEGGIGAEW